MKQHRGAAEVAVMMLTGTVCFLMIVSALGVILVEAFNPQADTGQIVSSLVDIINVVMGAVVGYLAGRSGTKSGDDTGHHEQPPSPETPEV